MMHRSRFAAALCAMALSACASHMPGAPMDTSAPPTSAMPAPNALAGTSWRLETLAGAPPVQGTSPTLQFSADSRVSGTTGCNRYFGAYQNDLGRFGDLGSTRMACDAPRMEQERTFLSILSGAQSVAVGSDGLLTVTGGDGRRAVFAPASTGS